MSLRRNWKTARIHAAMGFVAFLSGIAAAVWWLVGGSIVIAQPQPPASPPPAPQPFAHWPQDRTPSAVLILSGQTFGFLKPCGCSPEQYGGLERRLNLINQLKSKNWPVGGLDLGDLTASNPTGKALPEQIRMKYKYMMLGLKELGYSAVSVGENEFAQGLYSLLAEYTLAKPNEAPIILAANLAGVDDKGAIVPREKQFSAGDNTRPMIEDADVITIGTVPIGVVGIIGKSTGEKIKKLDANFTVTDEAAAMKAAHAKLDAHAKKPTLRVLLYQGTFDEARAAAKASPQFQIVLCQIEQSLPPMFPTYENNDKTLVIQVGHKGQNVGAVGVFATANGYDLTYQLVELGKQFESPAADVPQHKAIAVLQKYAEEVKKENYLEKATEKKDQHSNQIRYPDAKLSYVGSDKCITCHAGEGKVFKESKHSHALDALEKIAAKPTLRNFDPECVVCHVVGLKYQTGFVSPEKTPLLQHVGCEACHGPGSGHSASPNDANLILAMSPWKTRPTDKLIDKATMEKIGLLKPIDRGTLEGQLTQQQRLTERAVSNMCATCHDPDNDPKFDLFIYMPKIWHSGLKANSGLPKNIR